MNGGRIRHRVVVGTIAAGLLGAMVIVPWVWPAVRAATTWQQAASPGPLSAGHAFLSSKCAACHTPGMGVQAASCVACHANNAALLQRQPTAFHATVGNCAECHLEHQGTGSAPARMDHAVLADVGLRQAALIAKADSSAAARNEAMARWIRDPGDGAGLPPGPSAVSPKEAMLNCAACHGNQDRHRGLFGTNCVQCHATRAWNIPEFRHPGPASTSCAQCHQAPPSHYMMHFKMISMKVAGQEHAQVSECYRCHQTTSWNDIKGVGFYKHH